MTVGDTLGEKKKRTGKYEDISSYSTPKGFGNKIKYFWTFKFKPFFLKNQKRNLKAILSIFICLILVVSAAGGAYIRKMLSLINVNSGNFGNLDATFGAEDVDEAMSFDTIADIMSADSIKELLKTWATNGGEKIYNKKVINVLLIGEDDEDGSHRSDSTMLVSVNTKTKKITITSFLRDSYTYMNIEGHERYDKTNHSYAWGGAAALMEVLSNNYKIKIDHYVSINYKSFKAAVDALGGVTVPITEKEAKYMNRTTRVKGFESGDSVLLNGERALIYARIRKLDSEVERTRRQRELISSVIRNVKASSLSDLNYAIETFLPYITTNYSSGEILSLGMQALSEGWLKYEIVSQVMPTEELRYGVSNFRTYTGYLDVWIVDYIKAARELQLGLYGQTNIEINPMTHISAIDLARGKSASSNNYDDDDDNRYDDETTDDYEPHYYTEEVSSTRKSLFNNDWLNRGERTTSGEETTRNWYNPFEPSTEETTEDSGYYEEETTDDGGYYEEETTEDSGYYEETTTDPFYGPW
ncbi:MAG: LCP family protein [Clostridia bacterium]|nr:LCP family protein [Clostridia bacterium]